jgi:hypothetical protein
MPDASKQDFVGEEDGWFDRFGGKLVLVLLDNKRRPSLKGGRSLWALRDPLSYRTGDCDDMITVRPGFPTDLASIPRWAWIILPPDGPWVKAAVIHDFLYATSGTGVWKDGARGVSRSTAYSRKEADQILREAMQNRGVPLMRRTIIYWAVRLGGQRGWGQADQIARRAKADISDVLR